MPKNEPKKKSGDKARWSASDKAAAKKKDKGRRDPDKAARRSDAGTEGKRPRTERSPRWDTDRRATREEHAPRGRGRDEPRDDRGPRRVDDVVGHR
jgi:hypothetical protein